MVNPQLLDYIKQQLSQNTTKEILKSNLKTSGGWSDEDIDSAFSVLENPGVPVKPTKRAGFRLWNPVLFLITAYFINYALYLLSSIFEANDQTRIMVMVVGMFIVVSAFISRIQKEHRLTFTLFFISYLALFVNYNLLYPFPVVNPSAVDLLSMITVRNSFHVIMVYLVSFLSVTIIFDSVKKAFQDFIAFLILTFIYGSLSYYLFFMMLNKVVLTFLVILLSALPAIVLKSISKSRLVVVNKILIGISLVIVICLTGILVYSKSVTAVSCDSFQDEKQRYSCNLALARKDANIDICLKLDTPATSSSVPGCLFDVVLKLYETEKLDFAYCSALQNSDAQSICFNRLAIIDPQESYCGKVKVKYDSDNIILYRSPFDKDGIISNNTEDIGGESLDRDNCYSNIIKSGNLAPEPISCEKMTGTVAKQSCYYQAAIEKNDIVLCEKTGSERQDFCYYDIAQNTGDLTVCDKTSKLSLNGREFCYVNVAIAKKDPKICELVKKMTTDRYALGGSREGEDYTDYNYCIQNVK